MIPLKYVGGNYKPLIVRRQKVFRIFLWLILATTSPGCHHRDQDKVPSDVLPEKIMVSILSDIYLVEGTMIQLEYMQQKQPQSGVPYYQMIFEKHGVSREEFVSSMEIYAEDQELIDRIYDQVVQQLSEKQMDVQQQKEEIRTDTL